MIYNKGSMHSNLDCFVRCTTPVVQSQFLPKSEITNLNGLWQPWEREKVEYFTLGDLWKCYDEWSAYGAGVPITLTSGETLVQYYVPYLSAIQIFTSNSFRDETESGDCETRDSYSDSFSDESECDKLWRWDGTSSEEGGYEQDCLWHLNDRLGHLYCQYFERSNPYGSAASQNVQSQYEDWNRYESQESEKTTSASPSEIIQSNHGKPNAFSSQRSHLDMKFSRFLDNRPSIYGQVYESLAVSNAVELFKLVFLSTATSPQAPNLLADILRHYSEHDLLAAFNYLREKKIMVGGNSSDERFELSLRFLQSVSKSPFPFDTGKQAVKFSVWLNERDKDLTGMKTDLPEDLQCGDTFHLFASISSGEFSICPRLPDNGVGEADDLRSGKRKSDASGSSFSDKAKKLKSSFGAEGEIISRREKGFPGIVISVSRSTVSKADILDLFKDNDNNIKDQHFDGNYQLNMGQSSNYPLTDHMLETFNSCDPVTEERNHIESPWEAMAGYTRRLMTVPFDQEQECPVCAQVFVVVYAAIQKAGDQGLSMGEISQVINLPGADVDGLIVDALQAFGKALKVNGYDSVRIVDALYRHKYFLTAVSGLHPVVQPSSNKTIKKSDNTCSVSASADVLRERNSGLDNVHKVTILNFPHEDVDPENKACDRNEGCMQDRPGSSRGDLEKEMVKFPSDELCMPILPWINGDGTVNSIVFKGLRRRVLGIVMQNPGMLEDDILRQMHVLNPQSCKTLLELMVLDKHLTVRKMYHSRFAGSPSMLQNLIGSKSCQQKGICAEHFFANPMSTSLL